MRYDQIQIPKTEGHQKCTNPGEALEKDCLAYFATADLLLARHEVAEEVPGGGRNCQLVVLQLQILT